MPESISPGAEETMKTEGLSVAQAYDETGQEVPVDPTLPDETGLSPEDRAVVERKAAEQADELDPDADEPESFMDNRG